MGKYFQNKWLDALVNAIIAFITALSVASCTCAIL